MKKFNVTWHENDRHKFVRTNMITVPVINRDQAVKSVINIFEKSFGNLKKNTILSIQEIDNDGNPIGEPITKENVVEQ